MMNQKKPDGTAVLTKEVKELRSAVDKAYGAFKQSNQVRRSLAMSFLKGTTSALGALAAVVIVSPLIVWTIQSIAWPPLIAELMAKVIFQYHQANLQSPQAADGQ